MGIDDDGNGGGKDVSRRPQEIRKRRGILGIPTRIFYLFISILAFK